MRTSIFMFATDLHDEGFDTVLERVEFTGLDAVTLACAYHHARDVFPHNPVRRVRFLEGGAVFFRPEPSRFAGLRIQPHASTLTAQLDPLGETVERAGRLGLAVRGWTVFLHNTTLGSRHPECALQNAFGDPYITCLCPANPDVRAYAVALAASIAGYGVESILAESLSYHPFDHGYHHERAFVPLSPVMRYLLGLCFCEHCMAAASADGIDGPALRSAVRGALEAALSVGGVVDGAVERDAIGWLLDGELGRYLAVRERIVTSLVAEVTDAVSRTGGTSMLFMDPSGATKGYATGRPMGDPAPTIAWQDGIDISAVARASHGLSVIGYAVDPQRLRFDLDAYRALTPSGSPLSVAMRPMLPDCDGPENLRAKVRLARELDVAWIDFYHYGFMPLGQLEWISEAIQDDGEQ